MKVAHVIPSISSRLGGPAVAMLNYAHALQMQGSVKLSILTTTRLMPHGWVSNPPYLDGANIRIFKALGNSSRSFSVSFNGWLLAHIKDFDLIHVHAIFNLISLSACWIASLSGIPYIVRPLGTLSPFSRELYRQGMKKFYFRWFAKPALIKAVCLHCTTAAEERKVLEWIPQQTVTIPIPLQLNRWPQIDPQKRRIAVNAQPSILFLSRLHPKKNVHLVVEALARIKQLGIHKPRLILAGEGKPSYIDLLRRIAKDMNVDDCIEWKGFVTGTEKEKLLTAADVFVLPSQDENFGVAVAEAMAYGIPVIVSRDVDLAPLIQQYEAGLVVEQTAESVASALGSLLKEPSGNIEFGKNGRRLVQKELNPKRVGEQLLDLYSRILAN